MGELVAGVKTRLHFRRMPTDRFSDCTVRSNLNKFQHVWGLYRDLFVLHILGVGPGWCWDPVQRGSGTRDRILYRGGLGPNPVWCGPSCEQTDRHD